MKSSFQSHLAAGNADLVYGGLWFVILILEARESDQCLQNDGVKINLNNCISFQKLLKTHVFVSSSSMNRRLATWI